MFYSSLIVGTATTFRLVNASTFRTSCTKLNSGWLARSHLKKYQNESRCLSTLLNVSNTTKTPPTTVDDGQSPFQITTPIYYVNDKPHIGHAYTSIACDVLARFMRLSGREVFFLSGTDEHGQKVEDSAKKRGMTSQEFVDKVSVSFRNLLSMLNISNDMFIRTTDEQHKKSVQQLWRTLVDKGAIYLSSYEGWYSVRDECYYNESELVNGKAPTGSEVTWMEKEQSYFFKLSAFEGKLLEFYEKNPEFIAPASRRNEVLGFVKGGLRDLSISRTSFKWGVPVPDDDDHVMYVWIDALTNYISAVGYPEMDRGQFKKFWPANLHIIGKDILRFHAVYWPAFLMAADIPIPRRLYSHGWWTNDGEKISKSLGNVIDPLELIEQYGVDQTRFFLMAEMNFGSDGDFSHEKIIKKVNTNLANELGNLCQRSLSMVFKDCGKAIPTPGSYTPEDEAILAKARDLRENCGKAIASQAIEKYVKELVSIIWEANKYIDVMAPWELKKTDHSRMATVLYVILEVLRYSAILYQPLIPESANKILDLLTVRTEERTFDHLDAFPVKPGNSISKPKGVFPRLKLPTKESALS